MPRFGKNVLSQYLRTKCDKQLRLSLYAPTELAALGWPVPLEARPAVKILRDRGREWEQAKMHDLEGAFGPQVYGSKEGDSFKETDLYTKLAVNHTVPAFVVQGRFEHANLRTAFLQNIGLANADIIIIPEFTAFIPDVILIRTAAGDDTEILPNGEALPIVTGDQRKALLIADIKHAGEANSSYSSEVVLYAVLLANWLRLKQLEGTFFVANELGLWTRAKETSDLAKLIAANPAATITDRLNAYLGELERVEFPIFFQTVDHFFRQDLLRVLTIQNWTGLDWHVDSRCSTCDFLGHRNWLRASDRAMLDAHRDHYCVTAAEDLGHLSRVSTLSRGSRKTLEAAGHANVTAVARVQAADPVFDQHNALKADRNHLPHRATALMTGAVTVAPDTTTIDFPKYADLQIFVTVNFDPGTGLLSALGSEGRFRQRVPFGQVSTVVRAWGAEAQTLLTPTLDEERNVVISFLSRLAEIFRFVHNPAADHGGPDAASTRVHVYFWDRRQFEELARAIGRHLNAIVMPQTEAYLRGLAWLFPPEQLLEDNEITLANPITFMKSVIQRDLRLPVAHCSTLFNVAEVYHNDQFIPAIPGSFYRDPFSDMIPRERIYEVVWKFGADMAGRLNFAARPLAIGVPFNFQRMSEDGRLWYGWALLEESCGIIELRRTWTAEPEELEANYSILRLSQLLGTAPNGDLIYQVLPSSRDCKFRDHESFLALQDERIAGFLDLRVRDLLHDPDHRQVPVQDWTRKMADIFSGTLVNFDRSHLRARVSLTTFRGADNVRNALVTNGAVDLSSDVSLVPTSGPKMADRVRDCLCTIGRPPISVAAPATYAALGHIPGLNPPRNDAITPVSRVLWDATALGVEDTGLADTLIHSSIQVVAATGWPLNASQEAAIVHCLSHRLSIVWGPPGTGKTTTAAALAVARILAALQEDQNIRILITGPTYTAWENLFGEILTLLELTPVAGLACYRIYSSSHLERAPLPPTSNNVQDTEARAQDVGFQSLWGELHNAASVVLVGAVAHQCYRIANQGAKAPLAPLFDVVIIDESSQLDVGKSLFPLGLLACDAEAVLFGDHLQMPPVIATEPPRNAEWLVGSIQEYLRSRYQFPLQELLINYRSASSFVEFGKRIGYPPALSAHSEHLKLHQISASDAKPAAWRDAVPWFAGLKDILDANRHLVAVTYEDGRAGQANSFEADIVCSLVQHLFLTFSSALDNEISPAGENIVPTHTANEANSFWERAVGIVTPHRAQRALVVRRLREIFPTHDVQKIDAAVDTVERFQGGQRHTILISFGVGDPDLISDEEDFLLQLERTNVAISRARAKCVLLISEDLAYHLPSDRGTILTSKAVKSYVSDFCRQTERVEVIIGGVTRQLTVRWH